MSFILKLVAQRIALGSLATPVALANLQEFLGSATRQMLASARR
ncbi:hypothetical protein [Mesorhizobium abyssinicae]